MATEYKTLPIGTIFTYNGNEYEVCEDNNINYTCNQCAFNGINCDSIKNIRGNCTISGRTDYTQVYYKQINNETIKKDSGNYKHPPHRRGYIIPYNFPLNTRRGFKTIYYLMRLSQHDMITVIIDIIKVRHESINVILNACDKIEKENDKIIKFLYGGAE